MVWIHILANEQTVGIPVRLGKAVQAGGGCTGKGVFGLGDSKLP